MGWDRCFTTWVCVTSGYGRGIRRDERRAKEIEATMNSLLNDIRVSEDYDTVKAIIERYDAESKMTLDSIRAKRQRHILQRRNLQAAPAQRSIVDRALDIIFGQDQVCCALLCRKCGHHNGFCPAASYFGKEYKCKACGFANTNRLNQGEEKHKEEEEEEVAAATPKPKDD